MKRASERLEDLPSAVILVLLLFTASQRLYSTDWALGLGTSLLLTILGVFLGLALGYSQFRRMGVAWLSIGYSLILIPLATGWILYVKTPWLERILSLGGRLGNSIYLFITGQKVEDTLLFVVFAALGFWVISLMAGFALTRRGDYILSVLPAGIVLIIIQLFDSAVKERVIIAAFYAFFCLLLLGRLNLVRKRQFWREHRVSLSSESWTDLNLAIPVVALVLIMLTWLIPASGWQVETLKRTWQNITQPLEKIRETLGNAIAGLQGYESSKLVEFYGNTLSLGQKAATGEGIYLRISAPLVGRADRYYWRVRTYDMYLDNQWKSDFSTVEPTAPDHRPLQLIDLHGLSNKFEFSAPRANLAILVTPAHPVWISRTTLLTFTPAMDSFIDPLMFRADPPVLIGEKYSVHANIFNPTVAQLQQAGAIYPAWVRDHYLQLPADLSPRTLELARHITTDANTPYEKADSITNYLRTAITYQERIEPPPAGTDRLDWFLFDYQAGFCNYYASAEVILLRSVGVPARMVVGFAQGEYEPPNKYTILEKDAHAWPEVYFPGLGWVEFEPTSSQAVLARLPGDIVQTEQFNDSGTAAPGADNLDRAANPEEETGVESGAGPQPSSLVRIMVFFGLAAIVTIGLAAAYMSGLLEKTLGRLRMLANRSVPSMMIDVYAALAITPPGWLRRWAYYSGLKPIERAFGAIFQSLHWLGAGASPAQTPAEAVALLTKRLPQVKEEAGSLLREYQFALYSQRKNDLHTARQAAELIRRQALRSAFRIRLAVLKMNFWQRISKKKASS